MKILEILLEHGSQLDVVNVDGWTPLHRGKLLLLLTLLLLLLLLFSLLTTGLCVSVWALVMFRMSS